MLNLRGSAIAACILAASCGGGGGSAPGSSPAGNRAPVLGALVDVANGSDQSAIRVPLEVSDPDGDTLQVEVLVADGRVAAGYWDWTAGEVVLEPAGIGSTDVTVQASDGQATATGLFTVTVREVTRNVELVPTVPAASAVTVWNPGDLDVDFELSHNGETNFSDIAGIVAHVQAMPAEVPGESFPRKLWRFVRDNIYHWPFLGPETAFMNPLVTLNSLGWGLCTNVAVTYVEIARAAGYEARVWALNGHVVAEVYDRGAWRMFDPDLATYYLDSGGEILGVEALAQDTTLITAPRMPLFTSGYTTPYAQEVGAIYGTADDNLVWSVILPTPAGQSGRVVLPAGARLTYPGQWAAAPVGRDDNGAEYPVPAHAQAALDLPAGWQGVVPMPWLPWEITGDGEVEVQGQVFAAGSPALRAWLRDAIEPIRETRVAAAGDVRIIFLINPLRYGMAAANDVAVTGLRVAQLEVDTVELPEGERLPGPFPAEFRKPVPTEG
jgi:hypothetical protein